MSKVDERTEQAPPARETAAEAVQRIGKELQAAVDTGSGAKAQVQAKVARIRVVLGTPSVPELSPDLDTLDAIQAAIQRGPKERRPEAERLLDEAVALWDSYHDAEDTRFRLTGELAEAKERLRFEAVKPGGVLIEQSDSNPASLTPLVAEREGQGFTLAHIALRDAGALLIWRRGGAA